MMQTSTIFLKHTELDFAVRNYVYIKHRAYLSPEFINVGQGYLS